MPGIQLAQAHQLEHDQPKAKHVSRNRQLCCGVLHHTIGTLVRTVGGRRLCGTATRNHEIRVPARQQCRQPQVTNLNLPRVPIDVELVATQVTVDHGWLARVQIRQTQEDLACPFLDGSGSQVLVSLSIVTQVARRKILGNQVDDAVVLVTQVAADDVGVVDAQTLGHFGDDGLRLFVRQVVVCGVDL